MSEARMSEASDQPVTSMLAFCCAGEDELEDAATDGLRLKARGLRIYEAFAGAREACRGKLMVIDAYAAGGGEGRGEGRDLDYVEPAALLNLDPYRVPMAVTAAGGLITRDSEKSLELLLIYRRGVWDLPKGKQNEGESVAKCGLREVREELGIDDVRIVKELGRTVHGYPEGSKYAVKTTYWYLMDTPARHFDPQVEEDIEAVQWFEWSEARRRLGYETLRRHMDRIEYLVRVHP